MVSPSGTSDMQVGNSAIDLDSNVSRSMIRMPPVVLTQSLPETMQAHRQVGSSPGYSTNEDWPMS